MHIIRVSFLHYFLYFIYLYSEPQTQGCRFQLDTHQTDIGEEKNRLGGLFVCGMGREAEHNGKTMLSDGNEGLLRVGDQCISNGRDKEGFRKRSWRTILSYRMPR